MPNKTPDIDNMEYTLMVVDSVLSLIANLSANQREEEIPVNAAGLCCLCDLLSNTIKGCDE